MNNRPMWGEGNLTTMNFILRLFGRREKKRRQRSRARIYKMSEPVSTRPATIKRAPTAQQQADAAQADAEQEHKDEPGAA